jgi:drug/metabolite transporter (DMT)-like permease
MHFRASVVWILFASLMFATMSALVKVAAAGVSLPEIVFFRTLPAAVGLYVLARIRGQPIASRHPKLMALRCGVGIAGTFVSFYAVSNLPLATATTLEYTTPLFMLAYIVIVMRSRVTPSMALAMIGGFVGVVVLLRPTVQSGQTLAFAAGLASGIIAGIAYTILRRLGDAGESTSRIVLWYSVSANLVAGALIPFTPPSQYEGETVVALIAIGIVGLAAQIGLTRAFKSGPTTLLASLQYSTVAFAALYGVLLFGDTLSFTSFFGLSLIVLSGIVALRGAAKPIQVDT